jgi:hypothetical protein
VKIPTRGGNTLDLVLTNLDPFYLSDSIIAFPPFGLSDHSVIALSLLDSETLSITRKKSSINAI